MLYSTPMLFPDGRVMVLNEHNLWVEIKPLVVPEPQPVAVPPQQAQAASLPPVSQAPTTSSIPEDIAEEVLAQEPALATSTEPALAELPAKARTSIPVEENIEMRYFVKGMGFIGKRIVVKGP